MKEFKLITFRCYHCSLQVKAFIKKDKISFSINGNLYSEKDVLSKLGYYVCINCHKKSNIQFEYVYK